MVALRDFEQLRELLRRQGIRTAYVKNLSTKQDNEKNQIYLGGGLEGVTNLFPATIHSRSASENRLGHRIGCGQSLMSCCAPPPVLRSGLRRLGSV